MCIMWEKNADFSVKERGACSPLCVCTSVKMCSSRITFAPQAVQGSVSFVSAVWRVAVLTVNMRWALSLL